MLLNSQQKFLIVIINHSNIFFKKYLRTASLPKMFNRGNFLHELFQNVLLLETDNLKIEL